VATVGSAETWVNPLKPTTEAYWKNRYNLSSLLSASKLPTANVCVVVGCMCFFWRSVFCWLCVVQQLQPGAIARDQTKKLTLRPVESRTLCCNKWLSSRAVWHPTGSDWLRPRQLYRLKLDPLLHVAFVVYPRSVLGDHHRQCRCYVYNKRKRYSRRPRLLDTRYSDIDKAPPLVHSHRLFTSNGYKNNFDDLNRFVNWGTES